VVHTKTPTPVSDTHGFRRFAAFLRGVFVPEQDKNILLFNVRLVLERMGLPLF
jgi:hypothetical protein